MGVSISLAGVVLILPQRLFQRGDAGQVLRVQGNVVDPAGAAVRSISAVDGSHGYGYQERVSGGNDHFRDFGFCNQIQTQGQVFSFGLAVGIRQGHGCTVGGSVTLHGVFHSGGIGSQPGGQGGDQHIGLIEILGFIQSVRIFVPILSVCQAQGFQKIRTLSLVHSVEDFHVAVCSFGFAILENVSHLDIGKLDSLNGIPIACFAIAQSGGSITSQDVIYTGFVVDTGGYIAGIPNTVFFSIGQVIFVDGQGASAGFINGGHIGQLRSGGSYRERQEQGHSQKEGKNFCDVFHRAISFLLVLF